MSCVAIIVAAGRGTRMGFDKLMATVSGKSVLQWSLDAYLAVDAIDCVVVVTDQERFASLHWPDDRAVRRADGAAQRHLSVVEGLRAAPVGSTFSLIHDGARPLVCPTQIQACLRQARESGAAALARRATETLKLVDLNRKTCGAVSREGLWIMETPQVFRSELIERAYAEVLRKDLSVTDDVSAAETIGVATTLVENPHPNPKVTVPADLAIIEALLNTRHDPG